MELRTQTLHLKASLDVISTLSEGVAVNHVMKGIFGGFPMIKNKFNKVADVTGNSNIKDDLINHQLSA